MSQRCGGRGENRTPDAGFAVPCITTLLLGPRGHAPDTAPFRPPIEARIDHRTAAAPAGLNHFLTLGRARCSGPAWQRGRRHIGCRSLLGQGWPSGSTRGGPGQGDFAAGGSSPGCSILLISAVICRPMPAAGFARALFLLGMASI